MIVMYDSVNSKEIYEKVERKRNRVHQLAISFNSDRILGSNVYGTLFNKRSKTGTEGSRRLIGRTGLAELFTKMWCRSI